MYNRPAFIQITKKSIVAILKEQKVKNKHHNVICENMKQYVQAYVREQAIRLSDTAKECFKDD